MVEGASSSEEPAHDVSSSKLGSLVSWSNTQPGQDLESIGSHPRLEVIGLWPKGFSQTLRSMSSIS